MEMLTLAERIEGLGKEIAWWQPRSEKINRIITLAGLSWLGDGLNNQSPDFCQGPNLVTYQRESRTNRSPANYVSRLASKASSTITMGTLHHLYAVRYPVWQSARVPLPRTSQ